MFNAILDPIYSTIGKFLGWIEGWTNSYVLALFIFAIIVEILMLPFGIKQQKNSIKQAKLRPKEMAIRRKYAGRNDQATQQKMTQEIQELYQKEGYNPMGGCLPLLIQFPVIIVLYNIVINPLRHMMGMKEEHIKGLADFINTELLTEGVKKFDTRNTIRLVDYISHNIDSDGEVKFKFLEGIKDYTSELVTDGSAIYESVESAFENIPNFEFLGLNLADVPTITQPSWLWLIPVLTFAVYFGSMKLTRKLTYQPQMAANDQQQGCSNNIMDFTMPLMSVYITFIVPGAIGVYWIFKSLLSTLKQFIMSKVMPLPKFTEEDFKAAEKELKGKNERRNNVTRNPNAPKPRSLHYIDDEDYQATAPETKNTGKNYKQKPKQENKEQAPAEGMSSLVETPKLKDDKKDKKSKKSEEKVEDVKAEETPAEPSVSDKNEKDNKD